MIQREHLAFLALDYWSRDGEYLREKFENEFLENARLMRSFVELDR